MTAPAIMGTGVRALRGARLVPYARPAHIRPRLAHQRQIPYVGLVLSTSTAAPRRLLLVTVPQTAILRRAPMPSMTALVIMGTGARAQRDARLVPSARRGHIRPRFARRLRILYVGLVLSTSTVARRPLHLQTVRQTVILQRGRIPSMIAYATHNTLAREQQAVRPVPYVQRARFGLTLAPRRWIRSAVPARPTIFVHPILCRPRPVL